MIDWDKSLVATPVEAVVVSSDEAFTVNGEEHFPVAPLDVFTVTPDEAFLVNWDESLVTPVEAFAAGLDVFAAGTAVTAELVQQRFPRSRRYGGYFGGRS